MCQTIHKNVYVCMEIFIKVVCCFVMFKDILHIHKITITQLCMCSLCYLLAYGCPYNGDVEYYYDYDSPPVCYRSYRFCDYRMYRDYYYQYRYYDYDADPNCSRLFRYIHICMYCIHMFINKAIIIIYTWVVTQ